MNREETIKVLSVLKVAYPQFYAKQSPQDLQTAVLLWNEMFADDAYADVCSAVKGVIATDTTGFPPTIGIIKGMLRKLTKPMTDTSADAWATVRRAIGRSAMNSVKEFDKLPANIKRIVGGASQLRDWSMMPPETVDSVVQSNFLRSYRSLESQVNEIEALPSAVRATLGTGEVKRICD